MLLSEKKGARMSILENVSKPKDRPVVATIIGDAGLGKTSLAATFPNPVFIRAEDGMSSIPEGLRPPAFPRLHKVEELWEQLAALIKEDHSYDTVVIDSVTALEVMFTDHVLETDPKNPKGIQQAHGGYGAGRDMVASMHRRLRKAAEMLVERGVNVVFLAHADTVRIEPPDAEPYTKFTMRLHEKSTQPYVDNVDLVGFLRLETFVMGDGERKKAISDGTRQLVCHAVASNVSKNRFGITEPLEVKMGENPLAGIIPQLKKKGN
jgi:hypothetical protein